MSFVDTLKRLLLGPEEQPLPELRRNDRCWCGSGRKYKGCHMATDERKRSEQRAAAFRNRSQAPLTRGF